MDIDLDELAALIELLKEAEFAEFRYEKGDVRIVVRRGGVIAADDPQPREASAVSNANRNRRASPLADSVAAVARGVVPKSKAPLDDTVEGAELVRAPLLGTFYSRPKPGEKPFVSVGDSVEVDTVLCIIEVMKLMNSVAAGARGIIAAIHVTDGDLVDFGQPLFSITPIVE